MRISDWSSDVCSSDLIDAEATIAVCTDALDLRADQRHRFAHHAEKAKAAAARDRQYQLCACHTAHAGEHEWIAAGEQVAAGSVQAFHGVSLSGWSSEERRVGKECGGTGSTPGVP